MLFGADVLLEILLSGQCSSEPSTIFLHRLIRSEAGKDRAPSCDQHFPLSILCPCHWLSLTRGTVRGKSPTQKGNIVNLDVF